MRGAGLLIQAAVVLAVGLLLAGTVHQRVMAEWSISEAGVLFDRYQGGLGLAVERVSEAPYEDRAAVAASLSAYFSCPVKLAVVEGPLPRVETEGEPVFTVGLRDDDRALIIGPISAPERLYAADRYAVALLAVVAVMLGTAVFLVVPIARRLHLMEEQVRRLQTADPTPRLG